ncbi:MAG TPA: ABC transporter ATP-binding protein [Gammaproteobacteria bacterium]|nr:ABC transporter ATP-binding protein [Gammaproteobacteria bacterium]
MHLLLHFLRAYPARSTLMLLALLLAGMAEGIGLSALLPLLNIAVRNDTGRSAGDDANAFERIVLDTLHSLNIAPGIGSMLVIIVLAVTCRNLLLMFARQQVGYTAAQVATDLRLDMLSAMLRTRWEYFIHQPVGSVTNRLATEATRSAQAFVNGITIITFGIQSLVYGGVAVAVSWKATLFALAIGSLIIGASHFLVRMSKRAGKKQTKLLIQLMRRLTDTLTSVKSLKSMGKEHLAGQVLSMETTRLNKAMRRQVFASAVLNAAQDEMFSLVIALGMFIALTRLDMELTTVMVLVVVLGRMLSQLGKIQKQYQKMIVGESAFWSLHQGVQEARAAEEPMGSGETPSLEKGIHLQNVRFGYLPGQPVLHNIELDIPAGRLTTLTGASGGGKTTIVDLVIGLLKPWEGEIRIDGVPLQQLDLRAWRRMIGYVPQETMLLHSSVLHNVTLGDPALDEADAIHALKAASAWDFVQDLPEGLYSMVGERGIRLSGGQRQRIMIARALVHRPRLLIMDEATSALDPENEAAISRAMEALKGQLTILAISHQKAMIEAADRVWHLEGGRATRVDG